MLPLLAPILTTLLTNGLGLLGQAILQKGQKVVEDKLGIKIDDNVQTEDGLLKLRQLQIDHQEFLFTAALEDRKQDLAEFRAGVEDRNGARHMQEVALVSDDIVAKRFIYVFAAVWSVFSMLYMLAVTFMAIPSENMQTANTIQGFLFGTAIAAIFQYFLGTNMQSRVKDNTIANLSKEI